MNKHAFERGQTLPIVAVCLLLVFGFAALAVDAGYLEYKQRLQQTAADSAAIAGGWALLAGTDPQAAARSSSTANGYAHDGSTIVVSATSPPAAGPNSGNKNAVEVNITSTYPAIFSSVIGHSQNTVSTRAVAVIEDNPNGPCIWSLTGDFSDTNGTLNSPCGVIAAKNIQDNGATMNIPSLAAGGHVTYSPSGAVVSQGIPAFSDPCPGIPGCRALTAMFPFGSTPGPSPFLSCTASPASGSSMLPGCYTGLVDGTFNLSPGLYVFQGDLGKTNGVVLTCTTCSSGANGGGVTIVVGGKVNLNGSSTNLIAPPNYQGAGTPSVSTTAGAPGVLLYQTKTSTSTENFSAQSLIGMIYAPGAHLNLNGGGSTLAVTYVVAADIVANKSVISIPPSSGPGNPSQVPVLSE